MATAVQLDVLTFDFGTTPVEAIEQRHGFRLKGQHRIFRAAWPQRLHGWETEDLVTVLNSLRDARDVTVRPKDGVLVDFDSIPENRALRISILAALGIDES